MSPNETSPSDVPVPRGVQITLLLVATLTIMAGTIVAPALPAIRDRFADQPNVELLSRMVLTLPALAVVACAPVAGMLSDRFGRRNLLVFFILLYVVAGTSGLFVDSLPAILAGRAALGVAMGGIMTIGAALVGDYFQGEARGRFFGIQQAATQLGGVAFVVLGGLLAEIGWRAPFAVYGLALLIVPAAALLLSERPRPQIVAADGGNAARTPWAMIAALCLTAFGINLLFYSVPAQIGFFLLDLGSSRPSMTGWSIGIMNLAAAVMALNYSRLRQRLTIVETFAFSLTIVAFGALMLSAAEGPFSAMGALVVMGLGLGPAIPNILSAAVLMAPPLMRARITGLITSSMFLGHFVSPIASQPIIDARGYAGLYLTVGACFAVMACIAVVVLVALRSRGRAVA